MLVVCSDGEWAIPSKWNASGCGTSHQQHFDQFQAHWVGFRQVCEHTESCLCHGIQVMAG